MSEFSTLLKEGTALLRQGKHQQAIAILEEAKSLDSANFDVLLNLSGAYILAKKFKLAVKLLEQLRDQEPNNSMIWINLGAAYLGNPILASDDDQKSAIKAFKEALKHNQRAPSVAYNIGLIHSHRMEFVPAKKWFQKALDTFPDDKDAASMIAKMDAKIGEAKGKSGQASA